MKALQKSLKRALRQWSKIDKSAIGFVPPYARAHKDVIPVQIANIATALGPKLDEALDRGSRLCVVGYDGATLAKKGYVWRRKLSKWIRWGCSVDYFFRAPAAGVVEAISSISRKAPPDSGHIRMFQPKRRLSPEFKSEITQLETFHFAVSEKPPTLWIETNHQTSEPKAFDCFFFPEHAAIETGLAEVYRKRFDRLISQACDEIPTVSSRRKKSRKEKSRPRISGRHPVQSTA